MKRALPLLVGLLLVGPITLPADTFSLHSATIKDINDAMDAGALTSEKLIEMYLKRIEAYDQQGPSINTIITLNENALAEARALDRERAATGPRSPLHGIPVVLKDLYDTKDMPTTAGFLPMKNSIPEFDATIVKRLREAGAIILAKVNMSDWFGVPKPGDQSTILGRTLNPYNLDITPGGSSGGTGAALAAVFAQVGFGTETGVSIRNPTANNSLAGLAPSRGLIPRTGVTSTSFHQERVGPMARNVYDVAVLTEVVAGFDAEDLLTIKSLGHAPAKDYDEYLVEEGGLKGVRVGVFRDLFREGPRHEEGVRLVENAIAEMKAAGATIIDPVTTNIDLISIVREMRTNYWEGPFFYEVYFRRLGPNAPIKSVEELIEKGGNLVKPRIIEAYNSIPDLDNHKEYHARLKTQEMVREAILEAMDYYKVDVLVHPFKTLPPEGHLVRENEKDNPVSSITGLPAVLVPAGYTQEVNGPISVEFMGRPFSEPLLFRVTHAYEKISENRKHPSTVPPLPGESFNY